ncbi:MAG TPA: hypothetical protein VG015_04325 [Candidatus Dormibacteraeota bacterium]|nr:hypothetical protein [Candidatus Dormibacteraeota bacterium]
MTEADLVRWGKGGSIDEMVRRSFEFLRDREPAGSILASFQISDIKRYFPDFDGG